MSLTGILLDVSQSMRSKTKIGSDQETISWAQLFFKVIDDLVSYAVSDDNRVFVIGVGARIIGKEIFDVVGTFQQISEIMQTPATVEHINSILDILEKNGARNVRKWARDVARIQDAASDYTAAVILWTLETDEEFCHLFVNDFLPRSVRDTEQRAPDLDDVQPGSFRRRSAKIKRDSLSASLLSRLRPATTEDIEEIVEKAKSHISSTGKWIRPKFYSKEGSFRVVKEKGTQNTFSGKDASQIFKKVHRDSSIFSVQDAFSIIRGCFNEKELSAEKNREIRENIEPFIYCLTPLYEALEKTTDLFEGDSPETKLLFVLSDGQATDVDIEDINKLNRIKSKLEKAGVKIVSCYITGSTDIQPKRLYDKIPADCENEAEFLFSLSSKVPTQHLPRAILIKRGWTLDITNNETKLFVQVNHPDNLREACEMAKDIFSSDALSEVLVSVDLDMYISQSNSDFKAKKQQSGTCYANASAAVLHLAMKRIVGREEGYPSFEKLKDEMIKAYGNSGANTSDVLQNACQKYHLHSKRVSIKEAMDAIVRKRPVVARFRLTDTEWKDFSNFYQKNPTGILTQNEIDIRKRPAHASNQVKTSGHAVVFTSYNSRCLTFMNSWGQNWGDNGFFRVENAEVLPLEFFDVYWTLDELSEEEKENYHKHGSDVAAKLMKSLGGLQKAEYTCPDCKKSSLVIEFTGTLSRVRCPKCSHEFSTNDNTGNILALNIYLTSLAK